MKTYYQFFLFVIVGLANASAQSNLPACQGSEVSRWSNCVGTNTSISGNKYVGEFQDGKPNGQGTVTFENGNKYVGEWKYGKINGQGTYTFANGNKYVGEYKDGKRNGQFTATFVSGDKYVGAYKDDKVDGQGTYTFASGNKYVGEHKDGRRNGLGTLYASNGSIINQGIWADNNFVRSESVQQATAPNAEIERLRAEAEESKRLLVQAEDQRRIQSQLAEIRQRELEEQLKLAKLQNQVATPTAMTTIANRRALVIGNDSYKSVSKLLNAREDAKAMASSLESVGYKVTLKLDLNEKELKTVLRAFSNQVQGGDEVLFFFAGHGVQLGATNYLLPIDVGGESEAQVKDEAIQLQRVLDDMTEKKAKFTLAMIDACRDNPFKSTGRNIGGRGLAPTTAATGQMVVFSAGTGQQALDRLGNTDKNKNGVFTRTFLKEMQKPGVSIDRIVKNVREEVADLAKTIGHEQVPAIYDQVLGSFYFKK